MGLPALTNIILDVNSAGALLHDAIVMIEYARINGAYFSKEHLSLEDEEAYLRALVVWVWQHEGRWTDHKTWSSCAVKYKRFCLYNSVRERDERSRRSSTRGDNNWRSLNAVSPGSAAAEGMERWTFQLQVLGTNAGDGQELFRTFHLAWYNNAGEHRRGIHILEHPLLSTIRIPKGVYFLDKTKEQDLGAIAAKWREDYDARALAFSNLALSPSPYPTTAIATSFRQSLPGSSSQSYADTRSCTRSTFPPPPSPTSYGPPSTHRMQPRRSSSSAAYGMPPFQTALLGSSQQRLRAYGPHRSNHPPFPPGHPSSHGPTRLPPIAIGGYREERSLPRLGDVLAGAMDHDEAGSTWAA